MKVKKKWGTTDWGDKEEQNVGSNLRKIDFEISPEHLHGNLNVKVRSNVWVHNMDVVVINT